MENLLRNQKQVLPFQDDILVGGRSLKDHLLTLDRTLTILREANLKLKREKCQFLENQVEFLGHTLDAQGLHPQASKMTAIMDAPTPTNLETLRSFLGLLNYYSRFLPHNSTRLAPLYELLQKTVVWHWDAEQDTAFQDAKNTLRDSNLLVHYDVTKQVILASDASPVGVGAVISHEIDGLDRPIAFASRSLTKAEKNYSQLDREALAIIFGVKKFRDYLYGKKFILHTDHKPLVTLLASHRQIPQLAAARLQRWALLLAAYTYEIKFKSSIHNQNADALSRSPLPISSQETPTPAEYVFALNQVTSGPLTTKALDKLTQEDVELAKLHDYMRNGWPSDITDEHMAIYHRRRTELSNFNNILLMGNRVIIPRSQRQDLLRELHSSHQGVVKMQALMPISPAHWMESTSSSFPILTRNG